MKKIIASILALSLLISGCSHNLVKYSNESESEFYNRVNNLCKNRDDLTVVMISGQKYNAKEFIISADSSKFVEIGTNITLIKSTKEISSIDFPDSNKGTIDGLFNGLWIGGGTGLLLGQLLSGGSAGGIGRFYFLLYSVLAGVIIGTTYGYLNPGITIIRIN